MGVKVKFSLIFDMLIPVESNIYDSITFLLGNIVANSVTSFEKTFQFFFFIFILQSYCAS